MIKIKKLLLLAVIAVVANMGAFISLAHADEPLPPEEAFKFDATADGNSIKASWTAADGYYMYRDKIHFESGTPGIELGSPDYPKGKMKHGITPDGKEGEVETYMHTVTINVPVTKGSGELKLIAYSQGCAEELGICYPPQKREMTLTLATATDTAVGGINELSSALGLSGAGDMATDEPLLAEQAFKYSARIEGNKLIATWTVAKDYYMYKEKFHFESKTPGVTFGQPEIPKGKMKHGITPDGKEGEVETYMDQVTITVPILANKTGITNLNYVATGQGCAEVFGICYPPRKLSESISTETAFSVASNADTNVTTKPQASTDFVSEQDRSAEVLASGNTFKIIVFFFLGGLLLAFTACMYPMIPILSSIIVGQGEKMTATRGFIMSLTYVESMAVTFGIMGGLVAAFAGGVNLQAYFQSPWILIPFSILFIALAFSMFGFYTIQMPASLQGKLSEISNEQRGGSLIGVIIMGALSALIVGPCAGPVVVGALAFAAKDGNVLLGFLAMFVMGNGLGLPLLVVGTAGGEILPRAGGWMDTVKYVAGVILLAIAILFLGRISFIPPMVIMLLWSALFITAGTYMGAFDSIKEGSSGWSKLWKGLGLVLILYGVIVMIGGLTGARNVTDPMHGSSLTAGGSATHPQAELGFKRIKTAEDLQRELDKAKATGKYVMLDFYADWCTYCKDFEDYVFSNPEVQRLLADFVLLQADVTAGDKGDESLLKATGVIAPPSILFWDKDGKEKKKYRIVGSMNAQQFIDRVNLILKGN
ncbi:MAG: protein-disulfide reductase DsbD [Thioalkalispiraceae bacterium]|jgi:thiol:disulfide interchange protein DsbD